jgi:hypothetical protein
MFSGETYEPGEDRDRLLRQLWRVFYLMKDAHWRTLFEIQQLTGDPTQSVSARLRDFRKERFGSHAVNRRRIGPGLFEYQLVASGCAPLATERSTGSHGTNSSDHNHDGEHTGGSD